MKKGYLIGAGFLALLSCAGKDGEDGARGKAGESAVASVREATEEECPAGGSVLELGAGDDLEETVICNGRDGEQGPQGERGPRGDAGADGRSDLGRVAVALECEGALPDTVSLFAAYEMSIFTNGSAFVFAAITDGINQASSAAFYAPEAVGSTALGVAIIFDAQGPGIGGQWRFSINPETLESTVTYTDSDWTNGGATWTKAVEDCVVARYE